MTAADTTDGTVIEILDRIDRGWQSRSPVPVSELIAPLQDSFDFDYLSEVLAADSEWRWRLAGFNAEPSSEPGVYSEADRNPHFVEDYLEQFPKLRGEVSCVLKLIESEFLARSRWCNPPMIAEFVDRFDQIDEVDQHLVKVLDEHAPIWVARDSRAVSSSQSHQFTVKTPLIVGRCTKEERNGKWLTNDFRRLIVADNDEPGVSREHVRITRVAIDRVVIANVSSQSMLGVNGVDVLPGSAQQLLLPTTLDVGPSRLRLSVW
ncbi:MAG: FHA domain-containing protein [Pirellula sp.]|jgi:hypothetical protein|nr:FHA domain-containing protein [Pirellula sp.]